MSLAKKTIIITGASSGLGAAIAKIYAKSGNRLFLFGRSNERLGAVAALCRGLGAEVEEIVSDVTDSAFMQEKIQQIAEDCGIDIVIACAGVSAGTLDGPETLAQVHKIFDTNVNGVLNTIMPAVPHMIERRAGNIVIISSVAGLLGLSSAPSYSASKSAVLTFGQALTGYLKSFNVHVSTVIPGYIATPMTEVNQFPMPFKISSEKAALKIVRGIEKKKIVIAFPLVMYVIMRGLNLLPSRFVSYINSKLPGKPAFDEDR